MRKEIAIIAMILVCFSGAGVCADKVVVVPLIEEVAGPQGPPGPMGPAGPCGPEGPQGPSGEFADGGESGGADRSLGNTDNYDLSLITNDHKRLHIDNSGHVGIGTSDPQTLLDVNGDINTSGTLKAGGTDALKVFRANTFVGHAAGDATTTGNENTFIGEEAGYANTKGDGNVFLGYRAGYSETRSSKLYIDNSETDRPLIYGDFYQNLLKLNGTTQICDTTNVAVGDNFINRITPFAVGDSEGTQLLFDGNQIEQANESTSVYINYTSSSNVVLANGGGDVIMANGGGDVGIGTSHPDEKLEVNGNIMISGSDNGVVFPDGTVQRTSASPTSWYHVLPSDDGDPVTGCNSTRFKCVMNNEAVLDKETGLVWTRAHINLGGEEALDWNEALSACFKATVGGRMGWRLPTLGELLTLVLPYGTSSYWLPDGHPFLDFEASYYWTSTPVDRVETQSWAGYFVPGGPMYAQFKDRNCYVLAVRGVE